MAHKILHSSPFEAWLGVGPVPSNRDLEGIQLFLEEPRVELSAIDQEVEQLRRELQSRIQRRDKLVEAAKKRQLICHPIRRLPHEILQEIFLLCLDPPPPWPVLDANDAPLSLVRVCRDWRYVALSTPQLWDRLRIVIPFGEEAFVRFCMDQVKRWLCAAGVRPLTISLYETEHTSSSTSREIVQKTILQHTSCIKSLDLYLSDKILTDITDTLPHGSWTVLEQVTLTAWDDRSINVPDLVIWKAPRLKSVEWISVDDDFWELPIQWATMEEIRISVAEGQGGVEWVAFSASEARSTLQATPNLRTLQIPLSDNPDPSPLSDFPGGSNIVLKTPLILHFLTTLELVDVCLDPLLAPVIFLDDLQLPALTTLRYTLLTSSTVNSGRDDPDSVYAPLPSKDAHPLLRFLCNQKSPVAIRAFKIHTTAITRRGLLKCLTMMPLLERLWVEDAHALGFDSWLTEETGTSLDGSFLADLSPVAHVERHKLGEDTGGVQRLCPCLASLRLDCISCEVQEIEAFVIARSKSSVQRTTALTTSSLDPSRQDCHNTSSFVPLRRISLGIIPSSPMDLDDARAKWKKKFAEMDVHADIKVVALRGPAAEDLGGSSRTYYNPHRGIRDYLLELQSPSLTFHDFTWA